MRSVVILPPPSAVATIVSAPRPSKSPFRASQVSAVEFLAEVSMIANTAKAVFGRVTPEQVAALHTARAEFCKSEHASTPPARTTIRVRGAR